VADALTGSRAIGVPERITPRLQFDADERITAVLLPGEPGFDDAPLPEFVLTFAR
jgi:hypothetical protein